jgi:hypothetical protein
MSYETQWAGIEDGPVDLDNGAITDGGQYVILHGQDFGPASANAISAVTYGDDGKEFVACALGHDEDFDKDCHCDIVSSHDTINCTTVDGAGAGHRWILTIDGQDSTAPTTKCVPVLCERAQERASGRGAATRHQPRAKRAQTSASGRGAATGHQPT